MRFSIVIPVYKTEKYVNQCVDSVLCQTYTDFELILVDNESPDSCPEICENYAKKDSRVRVIHKKHGTAASARNVGMKSAKGDYLCFLDSDDFWVDEFVLEKINNKVQGGETDIVELYYKFYFELTGRELIPNSVNFVGFDTLSNEQKIDFLLKNDRLNPSAWGMCISRSFIEENNGYFDEEKVIEDIDWCIRLYSYCPRVDVIFDPVYVYRKEREGSVTRTMKFKSIIDLCGIIENAPKILNDKNNPIHEIMMNYVMYQMTILSALTYSKVPDMSDSSKKEIRKRLKIFCKKYLLKYQDHPKVKKAVKIYKLFGYGVMAWVLGFYLNHRGR